MEIDFTPNVELEFGLNDVPSPEIEFTTGGVSGAIDVVKVNGVPLPIVDYTVDIPVPTKTSQLQNDSRYITIADVPPVPTKTSQLQNDSGFITSSDVPTKTSQLQNDSGFITSSSVPTKTSELQNDSGFITSSSVPTKTSELQNDSGFITSSSVPTKTSQLQNDSGFITSSDIPVTSVNGQTGAVVIPTNTPLILTLGVDPNTGMVWSGAATPQDVVQAYEAGRPVIFVAPQLTSESYFSVSCWLEDANTAGVMAADNDIQFIKAELSSDFSASIDSINLQKQLTAGNNIQINNSTISATDTTYTAGTGLSLNGTQFSVNTTSTSYSMTDFPAHSAGTNNYSLSEKLGTVNLSVNAIWMNSVTTSWTQIATVPAAIRSSSEVSGVCAITDSNGAVKTFGKVNITTAGELRIRANTAQTALSSVALSMSWVIN